MLVYRSNVNSVGGGEIVGLDQFQQVLHRGNVFERILKVHTGEAGNGRVCHSKARTFKLAVVAKYGKRVFLDG